MRTSIHPSIHVPNCLSNSGLWGGGSRALQNNNRIIEIGNNNHLRYYFFNEKFVMGNCFILSKSLFALLWVCQDWNSGVCDWLIYWVWRSISLPKPVGFINFSVMMMLNAGLYDTQTRAAAYYQRKWSFLGKLVLPLLCVVHERWDLWSEKLSKSIHFFKNALFLIASGARSWRNQIV